MFRSLTTITTPFRIRFGKMFSLINPTHPVPEPRLSRTSELWGVAVKWGSEFKFSSSEEWCQTRLAAPNLVRMELDLSPKLVKKVYGGDDESYFAWSLSELPMLREGNIGKLILLE
ncbi:hypothetical protein ACFX13_012278 [Malus domestica]